jgi:hypothetical protein
MEDMCKNSKSQNFSSCCCDRKEEPEDWLMNPLNSALQLMRSCEDLIWCSRIETSYLLKKNDEDRNMLKTRKYTERKSNSLSALVLCLFGCVLLVCGSSLIVSSGFALGYLGLSLLITVMVMAGIAVKAFKNGRSFKDLGSFRCDNDENNDDNSDDDTIGSNDDSNQNTNSNEVDGSMMCSADDGECSEEYFAQLTSRLAEQVIGKWNAIADSASNALFSGFDGKYLESGFGGKMQPAITFSGFGGKAIESGFGGKTLMSGFGGKSLESGFGG